MIMMESMIEGRFYWCGEQTRDDLVGNKKIPAPLEIDKRGESR